MDKRRPFFSGLLKSVRRQLATERESCRRRLSSVLHRLTEVFKASFSARAHASKSLQDALEIRPVPDGLKLAAGDSDTDVEMHTPLKTVVITQSNYIPWRGYFDLFRRADEVVLLDSVQYTRRDWRNRNIIKTTTGPFWLTIPVEVKGRYHQSVDEAQVLDSSWVDVHRRSIELAYRKAACFDSEAPALFAMLEHVANEPLLTRINEITLRALCLRLGIATPIRRCVDLIDRDSLKAMTSSERLVQLTLAAQGTRYLSGPTARDYLDEAAFDRAELEVEWMSYDAYPVYPQVSTPFDGRVSIIDLLLNTGADAMAFIGPTAAVAPTVEGTR